METFASGLPLSTAVYWFLGHEKSLEFVAFHYNWLLEITAPFCDLKSNGEARAPYEIVIATLGMAWGGFTLLLYLLFVPLVVMFPLIWPIHYFFEPGYENLISSAVTKFEKYLRKKNWELGSIGGFFQGAITLYFWYDLSHLLTYFTGFPKC